MKYINTLLATLCIALLATSCSKELDGDTATNIDATQLINIDAFPTFDEGTQTRAIGTPDAGKTAWADRDEVLMSIQLKDGNTNVGDPTTHTLTYNGTTWTADPALNITLKDYRHKADITAYYAPNYGWSNGSLALKSGKQAGTDEYLTYTATDVTLANGISISFASNSRNYSRLRVAAAPDMSVVLTAANFTPAGTTTALGTEGTITATADSKGNAYFYGTWTGNTQLKVDLKEEVTSLTQVLTTTTATSDNGKSYAIDGFEHLTTYTAVGAGTEASPYRIYNAAQLMNFNSTFTAVACHKFIKLMNDIDLTGKNWTPLHQLYGSFDGNFHTIKGMTIVKSNNDYISFVEQINPSGVIQNLIIDGVTINDDSEGTMVGVFVSDHYGKIINCHVINGTITALGASYIGGLVLWNQGSIIGCSVINTAIIRAAGDGTIGGLAYKSVSIVKGCMFYGSMDVPSGYEAAWALAVAIRNNGSTSTSLYCQNTHINGTKQLWCTAVTQGGTAPNCEYVDGTSITWATAITNMNNAISSEITGYHYVYDATLGCPKMVKK